MIDTRRYELVQKEEEVFTTKLQVNYDLKIKEVTFWGNFSKYECDWKKQDKKKVNMRC